MENYLANKYPNDLTSVHLLLSYFHKAKVSDIQNITDFHLELVIIEMIEDYINFKIDPDQLAVLGDKLFFIIKDTPLKDSKLSDFLLEVGDLDWNLRKGVEGASEDLKKIMDKYEELKSRHKS